MRDFDYPVLLLVASGLSGFAWLFTQVSVFGFLFYALLVAGEVAFYLEERNAP